MQPISSVLNKFSFGSQQLSFLLLQSLSPPLFPNVCPNLYCCSCKGIILQIPFFIDDLSFYTTISHLAVLQIEVSDLHLQSTVIWSKMSAPAFPFIISTSAHQATSRCKFSQHFSPHMPSCLGNLLINFQQAYRTGNSRRKQIKLQVENGNDQHEEKSRVVWR